MEFVGVLPAPDHALPSRWIRLFGALATSEDSPRESETCHFCLVDVARDECFVTETPCCGHLVHSACFGRWLFVSASENANLTARYAYCRQDYVDMNFCFLCLRFKQVEEQLMQASCCRSTVHSACANLLHSQTLEMGESVHVECGGWATLCGCHWIGV